MKTLMNSPLLENVTMAGARKFELHQLLHQMAPDGDQKTMTNLAISDEQWRSKLLKVTPAMTVAQAHIFAQ
jgi:hypothetical protein